MGVATEKTEDILIDAITKETQLHTTAVKNIIQMLDEGNTVPFIARYRKENSGGADEVQIRAVQESWEYGKQLSARKQEVLRLIDEQGKLTEELTASITRAVKLQEVEDLYRPYRKKRRTRATIAKEKGLEQLADFISSQPREGDIKEAASAYVSEEKDVESSEQAVEGALDIIAEQMADDPEVRKKVRQLTAQHGLIAASKKKNAEDAQGIFEMYYEYEEPVRSVPSHRVLAMNRGEKEAVLKISIQMKEELIFSFLEKHVIKRFGSPAVPYLTKAYEDAYKRLIAPAVERELRNELSEKAEEQAIHIFSENLKNLLLQPPMKGKVVLGVDPAYRTGCKLAVINEVGKLLDIAVIYPVPPRNEVAKSKETVERMIDKYGVEVIVIGNGTASRETEEFVAEVIAERGQGVSYLIVNEAGASVYSASPLGREEFPDLEVEERSAVSIARRFQDPLAELVKIDPKSVGVGQYQHDVSQTKLNDSLKFVVETAVNQVGVNVNSASASLLQYVAGLSKAVANNIIKARDEKGRFQNRKELQSIPRLGAKTFEQAAGFLRVPDGEEPLDQTAIHPESYKVAGKLLEFIGVNAKEAGTETIKEKLEQVDVESMAREWGTGIPTLRDIIEDLKRPNRDPRDELPLPILKKGVMKMEDLEKGMELQGTVRNVVDFGAFVDIGVKQDGLVHISKLASRFIKHPMEVVSVGEVVTVWIEEVNVDKGRISLTMLPPAAQV
ncbi:Tex family protein [Bacillus piscicola]|uniref:Tex family protein n=1 Tax=Bacillus piscicola TaxID=1632684 RepID=UPI001F0923FE|nr:Tex family protein [Bacillus piscicola]